MNEKRILRESIFEKLGLSKHVARELNNELYRLYYIHAWQLRTAALVCKAEAEMALDPARDPADLYVRPKTLCGTYISRLKSHYDISPEALLELSDGELPLNALPYLARMLKGIKHLKKHMDVSALTVDDVPDMMLLFGLESSLVPGHLFSFNQEETERLARRAEKKSP